MPGHHHQLGGVETEGAVQQRARHVRDGGHEGAEEGAQRGLRPPWGLRLPRVQVLPEDRQIHHILGHLGGEEQTSQPLDVTRGCFAVRVRRQRPVEVDIH